MAYFRNTILSYVQTANKLGEPLSQWAFVTLYVRVDTLLAAEFVDAHHWLSTQFDFTLLDLMVGGHHGDRSQLCETRRAQCTALTSFIGCFCLPLFMEFFAAQHCSFRNKADSYRPISYVAVKTECRKSRYVLSCLVFQSPSTVSGLVASKVAS